MKQTIKHTVLAIGAALILAACGNNAAKSIGETTPPVFPRVETPAMITEPQAIADYMTTNYWRQFDFTDTLFLAHPEVLEQAFVDYVVILPYAGGNLASQSLSRLMDSARADTAMYRFFVDKTEHYLWDPNSPYRNDELYLPVLESMLASGAIDEATRLRSEYRLEWVKKNRPGTPAADFTYTLSSGREGKMSQIKAEYLLLFFNNPGCTTCADIIAHTQASPLMNALQQEKRNGAPRLEILAVYPDEDRTEWEKYLPQMPQHWMISYDKHQTIRQEKLYDVKAIPTLYLLDKNKKVILKDADIRDVETYLQRNALQ